MIAVDQCVRTNFSYVSEGIEKTRFKLTEEKLLRMQRNEFDYKFFLAFGMPSSVLPFFAKSCKKSFQPNTSLALFLPCVQNVEKTYSKPTVP